MHFVQEVREPVRVEAAEQTARRVERQVDQVAAVRLQTRDGRVQPRRTGQEAADEGAVGRIQISLSDEVVISQHPVGERRRETGVDNPHFRIAGANDAIGKVGRCSEVSVGVGVAKLRHDRQGYLADERLGGDQIQSGLLPLAVLLDTQSAGDGHVGG